MFLFNLQITDYYSNVYVFLLLCTLRSGYSVLFCCSDHCFCVNVYCTTATGVIPIAVNKYIIIPYHTQYNMFTTIISYTLQFQMRAHH